MCHFNSTGHVFPPTPHSGNELLVVSKIVSFCKLETSSSHPQMTERFLNIFSREDKKRGALGCVCLGVCVCVVCTSTERRTLLQVGVCTSQGIQNTRHWAQEYTLCARKQIYISNCRKISRMYMPDLIKTLKAECIWEAFASL